MNETHSGSGLFCYSLVVLGYQHLKGTGNPLKLTCQYLLAARNAICLRAYVRQACHRQHPNVIKVREDTVIYGRINASVTT